MESIHAFIISLAVTVSWVVVMVLIVKYLNKRDKQK